MSDIDYDGAGLYRYQVDLQADTPTAGAMGGYTDSWATVASGLAAKIEGVGSKAVFYIQQIRPEVTSVVTLRTWRRDVTSRHRLKLDIKDSGGAVIQTRYFIIDGTNDASGKKRRLEIYCHENP
jgi:head-tail adaptor